MWCIGAARGNTPTTPTLVRKVREVMQGHFRWARLSNINKALCFPCNSLIRTSFTDMLCKSGFERK